MRALRGLDRQTIQEAAVDRNAVTEVCLAGEVGRRLHDSDDRQIVGLCKLPVASILPRHGHDRARAVADEHVVGDPDRDFRTARGVDRKRTREDAGFFLLQLGALELALARGLLAVGLHRGAVLALRRAIDERCSGASTM